MPNITTNARTEPPQPTPQSFSWGGSTRELLEAAVVFAVSTIVPLPPVVRVMLAGFKLQVGRLCAPAGAAVKVQVRLIVPEYALPATKVTVPVALAPEETGGGAGTAITTWETVTELAPVAVA
jgi:hypothetical protein